jgi:glyceraldehyde-3-phosphate dehydrogenase (NAD(P))
MHAVRFNVRLRAPRAVAEIAAGLAAHPRLATTAKFDSHRVCELGRRVGFQGRLYAHAVVVVNDLLVSGRTVKGWAFVPQEGNTLLSTLEAFLLQTRPAEAEAITKRLGAELIARRL